MTASQIMPARLRRQSGGRAFAPAGSVRMGGAGGTIASWGALGGRMPQSPFRPNHLCAENPGSLPTFCDDACIVCIAWGIWVAGSVIHKYRPGLRGNTDPGNAHENLCLFALHKHAGLRYEARHQALDLRSWRNW